MFAIPKRYPKEFPDDVVRVARSREPGVRIKDVAPISRSRRPVDELDEPHRPRGRWRLSLANAELVESNEPVLLRPVVSGPNTSLDLEFAAGNADMQLSFGSTSDAFDNAAKETTRGRLKVEIAWIQGSIWFPHDPRPTLTGPRSLRCVLQPATPPDRPRPPHPSRVR